MPAATQDHRTAQPPNRLIALPPMGDPPDPSRGVVAHEQRSVRHHEQPHRAAPARAVRELPAGHEVLDRSEEHTSELQSLAYLVCRLLLEKKKKKTREKSVSRQTVTRT